MTDPRVLKLDGVHNFRDYGGYEGAEGARVKTGLLWRSAQHGDASDADLQAIHDLGIADVIDLRGPIERDSKPCRRHDGFAGQVWTYPEETAGLALHTEAADGVVTAAEARAAMVRLYDGIAFRENLVPMLRLYFELLHRADGPSLVHCVAGKDRTGFAVAMAQHVLGVSREAIMDDYLLTNSAGNIEARIEAGAVQIRERHGAISDETIRALMGVEADYLNATFRAVEARYGSLDTYLAEVLGIDAAKREALRGHYLEG
ncbi:MULTISPECIES: tyrosine-protein phosphatase [unclassified Novosphingobium]|uniref:tyrosine-protein phosphatase n=1 Tax=unclassified Novosphingobium TaxID=2644732 RepID=UPI0025D751C2|nr:MULTISPECIES: tyrosine-protein phosphatase [unclassified Novosphingobium]HQV02586.1 tyrosine-protein phosphatase [Novosphingobium sp.]